MLRGADLVRTDVSEERWIIFALMMGVIRSSETFLQKPHGVTSQNMIFFIITAVKTSNLT
jgi:hypothetical protein